MTTKALGDTRDGALQTIEKSPGGLRRADTTRGGLRDTARTGLEAPSLERGGAGTSGPHDATGPQVGGAIQVL